MIKNKKDVNNIIVSGYGGQGVLTLSQLITKSALDEGLFVRQSELHGLAQRGGALRSHIRIGKDKDEINSPLVTRGSSNLIISLDLLEGLRSCYWANKSETMMLSNEEIFWPYDKEKPDKKETKSRISDLVKKLKTYSADKIVEEITGETLSVNVYFFAKALKEGVLPFDKKTASKALKDKLGSKKKLFADNKKVFDKGLDE